MYNVRCIMNFNYKDYHKCKNIIRIKSEVIGKFFAGDRFSCDKEMFEYCHGANEYKYKTVELISIDKK